MKQPHSTALKYAAEPVVDLYQDETMAMVYVGDVYSLVVQSGTVGAEPRSEAGDDSDNDTLLPFIR
jgi:hypothetical protein